MEHPGEIWQELDYNGERLGGVDPATLDVDKVKLFSGVALMLYRFKDGEVEYLFQRRSRLLKANPNKWDVSSGGHVNVGEKRVQAMVREAREEIGVEIDLEKLELAGIFQRWKMLIGLYFCDWTGKEDNFSFSDQEVEEVKWVKYRDFEDFLPNLKATLGADEFFKIYLKEWNKKILEKYGDKKAE